MKIFYITLLCAILFSSCLKRNDVKDSFMVVTRNLKIDKAHFQYDQINKQLNLQKYSIVTIYADESKNLEYTFTKKNFGEIIFTDYDYRTIGDICNEYKNKIKAH